MAVADVKKINIIAHNNDKKKVVDFLYDLGSFEISKWKGQAEVVETSQVDEKVSELEYKLSEIQFVIKFLDEYKSKEKVSLGDRLAGSAITISPAKVKEIVKKVNLKSVVDNVQNIDEEMNKIKSKIDNYIEEEEILRKWIDLDLKIKGASETRFTRAMFGTVDSDKYLAFIRELEKKVGEVEIRKVSTDEQKDYILIIYNKKYDKKVSRIVFKYNLEKAELPQEDRTPKELIDDMIENRIKIAKLLKKYKKEAGEISKEQLENFKILFDYFSWRTSKLAAERDFSGTDNTFNIVGWIVQDDIKRLRKGLERKTDNFEIEELKREKGEPEPVIIRNSNFMQPFEAVTGIYGLPTSSEVDPTPFLSVFFIIFFGLCLTDAGYGLVLMTLTFLAIKVLKIPREKQTLIRLLMYGGFVTFIIGALTGGWFGIVIEDLPDSLWFLKSAMLWLQLINPVENPIVMLVLSFILGYIQILTGIAIDMWWKIKSKRLVDGLLDSGTWLYFLLSFGFWGATMAGVLPENLQSVALYAMYAGLALLVLTQGRNQKNIFMKFLAGVGSLYGLVGYMSDILSYSRLLALGLATAVIAMVINLIAVMFKDMVPIFGWVLMVLILIGGHIFNITINVLGAYIHSGRLQFVEFFPKFFKGGGVIFKPFRRKSKYVNLKETK